MVKQLPFFRVLKKYRFFDNNVQVFKQKKNGCHSKLYLNVHTEGVDLPTHELRNQMRGGPLLAGAKAIPLPEDHVHLTSGVNYGYQTIVTSNRLYIDSR